MARQASDLIVGSGPTAYAAALGLVSAGLRPTVIDFGSEPRLAGSGQRGSAALADKSDRNSSDPFAYPTELITSTPPMALPLSSARGGLSTIWGAGILFRSRLETPELAPVADGIEASFAALAASMRLAGGDDRISARFPWPVRVGPVPASARFDALRARAAELRTDRILVGGSRLALDVAGCIRCGSCLTGCPDRLFFSSDDAFAVLAREGQVDLVTGPVHRIRPDGAGVRVVTPGDVFVSERVYLAAGPIGTPALLQRSGLVSDTITVRDSAVFYAAALNSSPARGDEQEFTASQLMIAAPAPGEGDFVISVYESNSEFRERLARVLRVPSAVVPFPRQIRDRINAMIGSLPMASSGTLKLHFREDRTWVTAHTNPRTRQAARRALVEVREGLRGTGLRPIVATLITPPPGASYHSGCGLPMGGDDLDWSGRLVAHAAVRVVDASALPALWPGSHTFTAMANAHRIASGTA